jgi:hypothetical protein
MALFAIPGQPAGLNPESISPEIVVALWILWCAIAHQSSRLRRAPE